MKTRNTLAAMTGLLLVAATACQETPVTVDGGLDLPTSLASVHLKGGKKAIPNYSDLGLVLNAKGALSGLGNGDILVILDAIADVTAVCQNQGGNQAPGQNPAPISVSGEQSIPEAEVKNGNVKFDVTTVEPESPIPGAPDCPNPNWDEIIEDLDFTSATITVIQGGEVVYTRTDTP